MKEFLKGIYNTTDESTKRLYDSENLFLEIRAINNQGVIKKDFVEIKKLESELDKTINKIPSDYNTFFGVALRNNDKSGTKKDCKYLNGIYADIDCASSTRKHQSSFNTKEDALQFLNKMQLGESVVVDSGYGLHCYWLFDQLIELTDQNLKILESMMKSLSILVGGDSTQDVSRILRLPTCFFAGALRLDSFKRTV